MIDLKTDFVFSDYDSKGFRKAFVDDIIRDIFFEVRSEYMKNHNFSQDDLYNLDWEARQGMNDFCANAFEERLKKLHNFLMQNSRI